MIGQNSLLRAGQAVRFGIVLPIATSLCMMAVIGCDPVPTPPSPAAGGGVLLKTTNKVEEFDPKAGKQIQSDDVVITDPLFASLQAVGPIKQRIAGLGVDHAVRLFQATEGRYPKDFDEFMARIINENNMRLPSLPKGLSYQYDVENHKLVVVREDTGAAVE